MSLDAMIYTDPVSGNISVATDKRTSKHYQAIAPSQIMPSSGLTLLRAVFDLNPATAGDNQIVALTAGQTISVYGWEMCSFDAANLQWKSSVAGAVYPLFPFDINEKHTKNLQA